MIISRGPIIAVPVHVMIFDPDFQPRHLSQTAVFVDLVALVRRILNQYFTAGEVIRTPEEGLGARGLIRDDDGVALAYILTVFLVTKSCSELVLDSLDLVWV